jgi:glycine dehydrogenase subunit 1
MYLPHSDYEREAMLEAIGVKKIADLFEDVPTQHRFPNLKLPSSMTEMEVFDEVQALSAANENTHDLISFLGAGSYHHYVPSVIGALISRGEFLSAYTPYQPELSQGTLQAIYDYQSLVVALTGMEVSNASHYDGATAVAEAVNMANAHYRGKRSKIVLSPSLNPQYLETVRTYTTGSKLELVALEDEPLGSPDALKPYIDTNTALVVVQYPDFFGRLFDFRKLADDVHAAGALLCVATNPVALGLFTPPGEFGADIVTAEGQPLGIPMNFGGPYLGIFATKLEYVRKMAGRLVGETVDKDNKRGFVLTLTAREQHIRRDKATSNICSNQGLMALSAAIYLSVVGKQGLREVAELCYHKAHYAARQIAAIPGFKVDMSVPFFHEFVVECPIPVAKLNARLLDEGILGGYELIQAFPGRPEMANRLLVAVTEMNAREDIDTLVDALTEVSHD